MSSVLSNPFTVAQRLLFTRLSPAQCRARLADSLFTWETMPEEWSYDNPRLRNPVVGQVEGRFFRVSKYWRYRRPFEVQVRGEFEPSPGGGTRVRVTLAMRREIAAFFLFWFTSMLALQAALWLGLVGGLELAANPLAAWAPGLTALAGGAVYLLGRSAAKREADFLLDFLREVLHASLAPGGGSSAGPSLF